jgi:hypothetical protein
MQASRLTQIGLLALASAMIAPAQGSTAFGADDLVRRERGFDLQPAPDGRFVVFLGRMT